MLTTSFSPDWNRTGVHTLKLRIEPNYNLQIYKAPVTLSNIYLFTTVKGNTFAGNPAKSAGISKFVSPFGPENLYL